VKLLHPRKSKPAGHYCNRARSGGFLSEGFSSRLLRKCNTD
jgi:hypothetical protein